MSAADRHAAPKIRGLWKVAKKQASRVSYDSALISFRKLYPKLIWQNRG
jgi:hypothetical protein